MLLSRRAFERLIIFNTAIWIVVAVLGISALERSRDSLEAYLAPIGDELGGWIGLVLGDAAPGSEPLPAYELLVAPRILRAAEFSSPAHATLRDRGALPWFPARFRAGEAEHDVQAQLEPGAERGQAFEARAWRVRFSGTEAQHGLRELVLLPAGVRHHATALVARRVARELGLVSPPGGFATLRINGVNAGPFFWSESIGRGTFTRLGIPDGEILAPVSGSPHLPRALGSAVREELTFAHYTLTAENGPAPGRARDKLRHLLALTRDADDARFGSDVAQLLHVERYLAWNALSWLFGSSDSNSFLELAWYFDPVTGLLEPSVERFGSTPRLKDTARFDAEETSRLTERLLRIPRYRQRRNEILWRLVGDPDRDIVDDADAQLGSVLVRLARAPGSLTRLHALAELRRDSRETLSHNAAVFRAALVTGHVDVEPTFSTAGRKAHLRLALTPRGPADILLTEIRFDVSSLSFAREGEALLSVRDPRGREVLRATLAPEISGSTIILRPDPVVLSPTRATISETESRAAAAAWHAEITLPFFQARSWTSPGFLEQIEIAYRNSITGRSLAPTQLFFSPEADDDDAHGSVASRNSIRDVVSASGLPLAIRGDELWLRAGDHELASTLVVPSSHRLRLAPGVRLRLGPDVSIHTVRGLSAEGTAEAPIEIMARDPQQPWGSLAIARAPEVSSLRFVAISGGSQTSFDGIEFTGQIAFHAADAILRDVEIRDSVADGLSLQRSRFDIARSRFVANAGDGLDAGWSQGNVNESLFANNGDDGLDLGTSEALVAHSEFRQMTDKGISVGERSRASVTDCAVLDSSIGIASKEDSRVTISGTQFRGNHTGLALYSDNQAYGGGFAAVRNSVFSGNVNDMDVAPESSIEVADVTRERENTLARSFSVFLSSLATSGAR
ncbi:MAG: right-handed parallel beta-helix repeat-containing protein [Deltaproteobacteria bacterium]|nr:right-handed parallel beta-helix repeat-containing protein [Deltaproteobacteria bacterium]